MSDIARGFAQRENPDPSASSELEQAIQRALDESLDRSRFDLEAVICRADICQIFATDRTPPPVTEIGPPDLRHWAPNLTHLFTQLKETAGRNPRTGAVVGNPKLQQLNVSRDGSIITMIRFDGTD